MNTYQRPKAFTPAPEGYFYPFREVWRAGDFNFNEIADKLGLNRPRKELLDYLLRDLKIRVWFTFQDKDGIQERAMEICVLWECVEAHIASCSLSEIMEDSLSVKAWSEIGWNEELDALTALRDQIDRAIEERRELVETSA